MGCSMRKIIGRGMTNILIFISYREGKQLRRQMRFKFYLNIILMGLKILFSPFHSDIFKCSLVPFFYWKKWDHSSVCSCERTIALQEQRPALVPW